MLESQLRHKKGGFNRLFCVFLCPITAYKTIISFVIH